MARVKLSAILNDISGSVGGSTFQRSQYGLSLRSKPSPIHMVNSSTQLIQQYIKEAQYTWRYMNEAQKGTYDRFCQFHPQYARHNKTSLLSGYNLFMKHALIKLAAGFVPTPTITFASPPLVITSPIIQRSGSDLKMNIGVDISALEFVILAKMSRPLEFFRFSSKSSMRVIKTQYNAGPVIWIQDSYNAVYNRLPSIGDYIHASFTVVCNDSPIIYPVWQGYIQVT